MMMMMMMMMMLRYFLHLAVHRELFKSGPPHFCHRHSSPRGGDDALDDSDDFDDYACDNDYAEQIKKQKE